MGEISKNIKKIIKKANEVNEVLNDDLSKNAKTFQAFTLILYQDTTSYDCQTIINKLINYCNENNYKYAYIMHDKDFYHDNSFDDEYNLIGVAGELKKAHYHFVIICHKQIERYTITSLFAGDVTDNALYNNLRALKPNKIDNALLYLTHSAYKDRKKHQYDNNCVVSNIKPYCDYLYFNKTNNTEVFICIKEYLRKNNKYVSFIEIDDMLYENNIDNSSINSNYHRIRDMINEHNKQYNIMQDLYQSKQKDIINKINEVEKSNSITSKLLDVFDKVEVVEGDTTKTIMLVNRKDKKTK